MQDEPKSTEDVQKIMYSILAVNPRRPETAFDFQHQDAFREIIITFLRAAFYEPTV